MFSFFKTRPLFIRKVLSILQFHMEPKEFIVNILIPKKLSTLTLAAYRHLSACNLMEFVVGMLICTCGHNSICLHRIHWNSSFRCLFVHMVFYHYVVKRFDSHFNIHVSHMMAMTKCLIGVEQKYFIVPQTNINSTHTSRPTNTHTHQVMSPESLSHFLSCIQKPCLKHWRLSFYFIIILYWEHSSEKDL